MVAIGRQRLWSTLSLACVLLLAWPRQARTGVDKDTRAWQQRSSAGPRNNSWASMAYAGSGKMMAFSAGITWQYDVNAGTWTMHQPTPSPSSRSSYGLAYDSRRQRVVMFGGDYGDQYFNEIWEYDALAVQWRKLSPGSGPIPRRTPLWAYDEKRGLFVLFGGGVPDDQGQLTGIYDTWEWDGAVWTEKARTSVGIDDPRYAFYHPGRGKVVALHQRGIPSEWDGSKWTYLDHTNVELPSGPAFAYAGNGRMIAFGGVENWSSNSNASWESDGKAWYRIATSATPSGRTAPLIAYDPSRGRVVLSSGIQYFFDDKTPPLYPTDTWEYQVTALDNGSTCDVAQADQCTSKLCLHGVCCLSACTGPCESCAVPGFEGQCRPMVSAACPAPGTGGSGPSPGPDAAAGMGGSSGAGGASGAGGNGGASATGTGGTTSDDASAANDAAATDGLPRPAGSGGSNAGAPVSPRRGHYAGPACSFAASARQSAPPALWLAALLAGLRRRRSWRR